MGKILFRPIFLYWRHHGLAVITWMRKFTFQVCFKMVCSLLIRLSSKWLCNIFSGALHESALLHELNINDEQVLEKDYFRPYVSNVSYTIFNNAYILRFPLSRTTLISINKKPLYFYESSSTKI